MDINNFVQLFAEQFDETDAKSFTPKTVFKELEEWSSLLALSIIAMVDEEFDVILKGDDIHSSVTIEDLFNLIENKK